MTAEDHKRTVPRRAALIVLIGLYSVSFALPVTDAGTAHELRGYEAFFLSLVFVVYLPMWCANPVFWYGCFSFANGRFRVARNGGLTAAALAVSEVWLCDDRLEIGYWVWLVSMLLLVAAGTVLARRNQDSV